jgi:hypothetical protein
MLSDKAWSFVESRRGTTPVDQYVSMLVENIADLSGEGIATEDGSRVIDEIEAYAPPQSSIRGEMVKGTLSEHREVLERTIDYLRDAYHDRVPRHVFEKKCRERGISALEILEAEKRYGQWLV